MRSLRLRPVTYRVAIALIALLCTCVFVLESAFSEVTAVYAETIDALLEKTISGTMPPIAGRMVDGHFAQKYPGNYVLYKEWGTTDKDGYTFTETIKIWESIEAMDYYLHPNNYDLILLPHTAGTFIIPFVKTITNTTKGFNTAPFNQRFIAGDATIYSELAHVYYNNGTVEEQMKYCADRGYPYFEVGMFQSDRVLYYVNGYTIDNSAANGIYEGETIVYEGFYLIKEPPKAPNRPTGLTQDDIAEKGPFVLCAGFYNREYSKIVGILGKDENGRWSIHE